MIADWSGQLCGITTEELQAVQRWNGPGVIRLLRGQAETGGGLLVTRPGRRGLFEVGGQARGLVEAGIQAEGSNLCGMAAVVAWTEPEPGAAAGPAQQVGMLQIVIQVKSD